MSDNDTALSIQQPAQLASFTEQSTSMMQQLATAQIQSRYIMAARFPRNVEQVRQNMLTECMRPEFCMPDPSKHGSSLAVYAVPRGNVKNANGDWVPNIIRGFSIRFAEMAARAWKNLSVDVVPLGEDKTQRIFQVTATDFEANITASQIVTVPKTVERSSNKDNRPVLSQRTNNYGKPVFTLDATEDEISMSAQRLISKGRRNLILQFIPGWILEECTRRVNETAANKDAEAPDVARRRIFDAFASVGVSADQLTAFIGHTNALSPAEMEDLRGFFSAIREGAATWQQIVESRENSEGGTPNPVEAEIDELLVKLEYTTARARNIKAKHVAPGGGEKLVTYLREELSKKQNTGARQGQEPSASDPTITTQKQDVPRTAATSEETAPASTNMNQSTRSQDSGKTEVKPEPAKPVTQPKKMAPAAEFKGW